MLLDNQQSQINKIVQIELNIGSFTNKLHCQLVKILALLTTENLCQIPEQLEGHC